VDLDTNEVVEVTKPEGDMVELDSQISIKKHLRPGYIITTQENKDKAPMNTKDLIDLPFDLTINRDKDGYATGQLFLDDGELVSDVEGDNQKYEYYEFTMTNSRTLQKNIMHTSSLDKYQLSSIKIVDAEDL